MPAHINKAKRYFSISNREKYCPYCDRIRNLREFRRSSRKQARPEQASYYMSVCKPCETDTASIRQYLKTGYRFTLKSISEETRKRFLKLGLKGEVA